MKSRRVIVLSAIVGLVIAVGLSGCSQSQDSSENPTPTPSASSTTTDVALAQYWVAETSRGPRLYREFVKISPLPDAITASLEHLVSKTPTDSDYLSLWPLDTKINSVIVQGDTAIIDLTFGKLNVGAEAESLAIAQLVWTATAAEPSVKRVSITLDGNKVESLAGHADATKTFSRGPAYKVIAPIWITSPFENQTLAANGFTLTGMASTFEANVVWRVIKDGVVIKEGATTALEAAPAWKPWSVTVPGLSPGKYFIQAIEYSAEDGSIVAQDTKNVTLK